jgi:uncharacterized membrane protein YraQ (UPF0718 family)
MYRRFWLRVLKIISMVLAGIAFAVLFALVFGFVVQYLWNYLMPELFGVKTITYWQAFAFVILIKLLFGAWGSYRGRRHHRGNKLWHGWRHGDWNDEWCSGIPHEKWRYYKDFWKEEGKSAFEEYIKKAEHSKKNSEK